jgi:aspartyl-tRNA(Asn)/glutamyl-tRNA(Gln) amidotransferase subunit A
MTNACDLTLLQAAERIKARTLSPVELTESVLRRIALTEPALHAYVLVDGDRARAAALAAEAEISGGSYRGPLHGIPIAVKDIFDLADHRTRCNSRVRDSAPPATSDAVSVAKVRAAGAILVGKTVTQEFAAGVVSDPARNPWDPTRIPGGSSGGSGAAVAAGSCIAAFGSDTGGSIRNPASTNGVAGLKPTYGAVSKRGVFPLAWSLDTVGPLARTVADAATFFNVIAGHDPLDVGSSSRVAGDATAEIGPSLKGLRIGVLRPFFFDQLQPDVAAALEAAFVLLRELGATVIRTPWAEARLARAASFVINRVEVCEIHAGAIRATPELFGEELRLRLESNSLYPATGYLKALRARSVVKQSMAALFAEHQLDALVAPTAAGTAAPADDLTINYADGSAESVHLAYTRLTMPFNATGQPVVAVPCGFDRQALPIGMQVVGRPFAEARICRIAHAFEQATGLVDRRPPMIAG